MGDDRAIGMFDSGVGGLTVAQAVFRELPNESLIYVGDTAHSPYGPRSLEEIRAFALDIATYLVSRDVKMIVVACNSVEVAAIAEVAMSARVPVVGVIDPGVRAAVRATRSGMVGLLGTEATVASGAYERAVDRAGSHIALLPVACPRFVGFVEAGDTSSAELREAALEYLDPLARTEVDTLILGCTHYPLLSNVIRSALGRPVTLVSSADETAADVRRVLVDAGAARVGVRAAEREYLATGDPAHFETVARHFIGREVSGVRALSLPSGVTS